MMFRLVIGFIMRIGFILGYFLSIPFESNGKMNGVAFLLITIVIEAVFIYLYFKYPDKFFSS